MAACPFGTCRRTQSGQTWNICRAMPVNTLMFSLLYVWLRPGTVKNLYNRCKIGLQALCCRRIYGIVAAFCFSLRRMAGIDLSTVALVGPEIRMPEKCLCACSSEIGPGGQCGADSAGASARESLSGMRLLGIS